jgi:hypothetical protein
MNDGLIDGTWRRDNAKAADKTPRLVQADPIRSPDRSVPDKKL